MSISCRAPRWSRHERVALPAITAEGVRPIPNGQRAIQMFVNSDLQVCHRGSQQSGFDLKEKVGPSHVVVFVHNAFVLDGKHSIQILPLQWHKCRSTLSGGPSKFSIELRNVALS